MPSWRIVVAPRRSSVSRKSARVSWPLMIRHNSSSSKSTSNRKNNHHHNNNRNNHSSHRNNHHHHNSHRNNHHHHNNSHRHHHHHDGFRVCSTQLCLRDMRRLRGKHFSAHPTRCAPFSEK